MKLLPALKQKKRYILFEVLTEQKVTKQDLENLAKEALLRFLGEFGTAKAAPLFIKSQGKKFILKVNHTAVNEAKAALTFSKTLKKKPIIVKSVITSGTLKKAQSYL